MSAVATPPAKPPRKQNPPPMRPLIVRPPVYRKLFKLPAPHEGRGVVELHQDKIVLHRYGGRTRKEIPFALLWSLWKGELPL